MNDLRQKTAVGFMYKLLERGGAQGINFIISLLLARILTPDEYGTVALVVVFINMCDVFVTYGFGNSLIVDKEADKVDFSTCFYFGIGLSLIVYAAVFFSAPLLASYYNNDVLVPVLRVMGLRVPIAAVNSVQHAYVSKKMRFKKFFYSTLIGTLISGVIAVIMAYCDFGVWALVEQYLGTVFISTVVLWFAAKWRPTLEFSLKKLKKIYNYGWKILVVGLIDTGYTELKNLVIAKRYTSSDLAYYNKGNNFPALGMRLVEPSITGVLFPALSHCNDDKKEMLAITRKFTLVGTYIIFPILVGLAVVSEPLITVLLTEKWLPCVIFMQLSCAAYMFRPMRFISNSVIKANGKSGLLLKLDIVKKVIGIGLLILSMRYGVVGIALSVVVSNAIASLINIFPLKKLIDYSYWAQFKDVFYNLVLSLAMGALVYLVLFLGLHPVLTLGLQLIVGIIFYAGVSLLFKHKAFIYIYNFATKSIKNFISKRNKSGNASE